MLLKNPDRKISILTCYDFPTARALDKSDIDAVLVGDSLGTNVLGYDSELQVTMDDMVHHLKAVRRGITAKIIIADLPYKSYVTVDQALVNAQRLAQAGADIVKLEGGRDYAEIIRAIVGGGIAVMGHLGFQPQIAQQGKRAVVGAVAEEAAALYRDARVLQEAGAGSLVLECVPEKVGKAVTDMLAIPTIGIGSGRYTDGQVLVWLDMAGWDHVPFRFVKRYEEFHHRMVRAADQFGSDVRGGLFPLRSNAFGIKAEQLQAFLSAVVKDVP